MGDGLNMLGSVVIGSYYPKTLDGFHGSQKVRYTGKDKDILAKGPDFKISGNVPFYVLSWGVKNWAILVPLQSPDSYFNLGCGQDRIDHERRI